MHFIFLFILLVVSGSTAFAAEHAGVIWWGLKSEIRYTDTALGRIGHPGNTTNRAQHPDVTPRRTRSTRDASNTREIIAALRASKTLVLCYGDFPFSRWDKNIISKSVINNKLKG